MNQWIFEANCSAIQFYYDGSVYTDIGKLVYDKFGVQRPPEFPEVFGNMTCYHISEVTDNMAWQYDMSDNTVLEKMLRIHIPRMFISKTFFSCIEIQGKRERTLKGL